MIDYILDAECSGLNNGLKLDSPVQVTMTDLYGRPVFQRYFLPAVPMDKEAVETHGLTLSRLEELDAWTLEAGLPELADMLAGARLHIYNAAYDVRILLNAAWHAGIVLPKFTYQCVMTRYAEAFGYPHKTRPGEFRWWSLGAAVEQQFGFLPELELAHDAFIDCVLTAKLLEAMDANELVTPTIAPEYEVRFAEVELGFTYKGDRYLKFHTFGGQSVNVFDGQFNRLDGLTPTPWKLVDLLSREATGYRYSLREGYTVGYITYGTPGRWREFPELNRLTEY
jgi:DNA polymerase III epsilon subunit-like protein